MRSGPLKSIRKYCLWCANKQSEEVRLCPSKDCPLYPFRMNKGVLGKSRLKAIRARCKDCGEGTYKAIRECKFSDCPLYQYRMGRNPRLSGKRGGKGNFEPLRQYRLKKEKLRSESRVKGKTN